MKGTNITAIFQGKDGSMGFINGDEYKIGLFIEANKVEIHHSRPGSLIPYRVVEYSNLGKFLENWKDINLNKDEIYKNRV